MGFNVNRELKRFLKEDIIKKKTIASKSGKSYFVYTIALGSDIKFIQNLISTSSLYNYSTGELSSISDQEQEWEKVKC